MELKFGVELLFQRDGVDKSEELNQFLDAIKILPKNFQNIKLENWINRE